MTTEEKAKAYAEKELVRAINRPAHPLDHLAPYFDSKDVQQAYLAGATEALASQWVSVDERLPEISDEGCIAEGVCKWTKDKELFKYDMADGFEMFEWRNMPRTPREAYAALIDRISGKGTWESNPYVFVYEFELII